MKEGISKRNEILPDEIKNIQINILREIVNICEENSIRYFLGYGTLLGAIRHKGFIPWDDDIDIIMPRPDYDRFLATVEGKLSPHLNVMSMYNSKDYIYPFAKVIDNRTILDELSMKGMSIGVYVDIFPMDGLPSDRKLSDYHFLHIYYLLMLFFFTVVKHTECNPCIAGVLLNLFISIMRIIGKMYNGNKILLLVDKTARKYDFDDSEFTAVTVLSTYGRKERINKTGLTDYIKVEFEGGLYNAPCTYHQYLTNIYGDYMQLPPEKKRVSRHNHKVYWKQDDKLIVF